MIELEFTCLTCGGRGRVKQTVYNAEEKVINLLSEYKQYTTRGIKLTIPSITDKKLAKLRRLGFIRLLRSQTGDMYTLTPKGKRYKFKLEKNNED